MTNSVVVLPLHFAFHLSLSDGLALVVFVLSAGESKLNLRMLPFEVDPERNECHPFHGRLPDQLSYLLAVEEEAARPVGIMVDIPTPLVGADVRSLEDQLAVPDDSIALLQVHLPLAKGLHLCPNERDARFVCLYDEELVARLPVRRHNPFVDPPFHFLHRDEKYSKCEEKKQSNRKHAAVVPCLLHCVSRKVRPAGSEVVQHTLRRVVSRVGLEDVPAHQ